ncbi:MAG: hypothetical protein N3E45_00820 [Oscillatoriaceae bacterium SKW80]|nr:hypothetical protein [Oscillatoriaceae bacterium SKYG93]MCX8119371.1 hypothetical protein [Oscillatoriaceae bacterium SKW80]MDW8454838.1 hypothetical protein [Oscillatoriaceae cyanobacterium SKYGB_i_bin93]HIK28383.1 hypothetical protein [Oscillatoriaceae cyanobacterium M7585_C2015_266]
MTGFIRNIFGSKPKATAPAALKPEKPVAPANNTGSFYLDADEAKTLGDINYMRAARTIKKSFPKVAGGKKENVERVEMISSIEKKSTSEKSVSNVSSTFVSEMNVQMSATSSERRRPDRSMDVFRKMARDIKKS